MSQRETSYTGKINLADWMKTIDNYRSGINNRANNTILLKFNSRKFKVQHQLKVCKIKSLD